jgi:hypothetical protein
MWEPSNKGKADEAWSTTKAGFPEAFAAGLATDVASHEDIDAKGNRFAHFPVENSPY